MRVVADRLAPAWTAAQKRLRDPELAQALRSTAAATISYVLALHLTRNPAPLTAPLTALLVVQVTLYATIKRGVRRVNAVVSGVLVAIAFSTLIGLTWWSLCMIILAALAVGRFVRAHEFEAEVAISAMLVLSVAQVASNAWERVLETLIGAATGLFFNLVFAPPVWVETAGDSFQELARRMRRLLIRLSDQLDVYTPVESAAARLEEARQLDRDIAEVDVSLRQAEDSLRLNPRVREGRLHRAVLRTGLDTLEICTVVLRVTARTLTDLAREREERGEEAVLLREPQVALSVRELLGHVADALVSFSVLVTTHTSKESETAEERLRSELAAAGASRDTAARLLLDLVQGNPEQWQLHGALLTEIDRILDELDMENRSRRLMEELDRTSRELHERYPRLMRLRRRAQRRARRWFPRLAGRR